jgi:hypothetical protein
MMECLFISSLQLGSQRGPDMIFELTPGGREGTGLHGFGTRPFHAKALWQVVALRIGLGDRIAPLHYLPKNPLISPQIRMF